MTYPLKGFVVGHLRRALVVARSVLYKVAALSTGFEVASLPLLKVIVAELEGPSIDFGVLAAFGLAGRTLDSPFHVLLFI